MGLFAEILKYTLPGMVVFLTTYLLFKEFFQHQYHQKMLELKQNDSKTTLPLRLQSYERLSLFCERIAIPNLMMRLKNTSSTNQSLQYAMVLSIQQEFEHNISQQIYVSDQLWQIIKLAKETMMNIINTNAQGLDPQGSSDELVKVLFAHISENASPNDLAVNAIRKEASKLF